MRLGGRDFGLDHDLILLAEDRAEIEGARQRLAHASIERVVGYVDGGIASWVEAGLPLGQTTQISVDDLAGDPAIVILDMRTPAEWRAGHLVGAVSAPLGQLSRRDCKTRYETNDRRPLQGRLPLRIP